MGVHVEPFFKSKPRILITVNQVGSVKCGRCDHFLMNIFQLGSQKSPCHIHTGEGENLNEKLNEF